ncbi:hypothetical protein AURDEDRAFT_128900 [Auricularia subglabra TFB-10046 SS5]|nr:hypothetical protein AURDEDRAFT_128900 [Auricularia subglabra TFB-10046 SS5]
MYSSNKRSGRVATKSALRVEEDTDDSGWLSSAFDSEDFEFNEDVSGDDIGDTRSEIAGSPSGQNDAMQIDGTDQNKSPIGNKDISLGYRRRFHPFHQRVISANLSYGGAPQSANLNSNQEQARTERPRRSRAKPGARAAESRRDAQNLSRQSQERGDTAGRYGAEDARAPDSYREEAAYGRGHYHTTSRVKDSYAPRRGWRPAGNGHRVRDTRHKTGNTSSDWSMRNEPAPRYHEPRFPKGNSSWQQDRRVPDGYYQDRRESVGYYPGAGNDYTDRDRMIGDDRRGLNIPYDHRSAPWFRRTQDYRGGYPQDEYRSPREWNGAAYEDRRGSPSRQMRQSSRHAPEAGTSARKQAPRPAKEYDYGYAWRGNEQPRHGRY